MFFIGDVYHPNPRPPPNPSPPPHNHGLKNHGLRNNEFHKPNPKPNPKPPNILFTSVVFYSYILKFCNTNNSFMYYKNVVCC